MLLTLALLSWSGGARAQVAPPDTVASQPDTLRLPAAQKGDIETTIVYSARDSIRFDVVSKIMYLYGNAKIDYGATSLAAEQIQINWGLNTIFANGVPDSAGKLQGTPVFKDETEQYEAERIAYNYKTKRGKISGATTKQGEGFIHAEVVKKNAENELFGLNARYSTCDLKHPHYFINAHKMKIEPGKKVITGPFNLWVGDIPTPLGFMFGLFPAPKKRGSGIIIPKFGQTRLQGFYLREGGYYWAMNDYVGMKILGDVYSFGGGGGSIQTDYYKRYRFRGGLNVRYNYMPDLDAVEQTATVGLVRTPRFENQSFWINWNHNPEPRGGGLFRASVQAGTNGYNRQYSRNMGNYLSPSFNSSVSYSRTLQNSPFNYTIAATQSQNSESGVMTFNLPDVTLGMNRVYPLKNLIEVPTGQWYETFTRQFAFDYRLSASNQISNDIAGDRLRLSQEFPDSAYKPLSFNGRNLSRILDNSNAGAQHSVGITLGSYKLLKHLTLTPTVSYNERWYLKQLNYRFNQQSGLLESDTIGGFNRVYEYAGGASLNTRFYGMYNVNGKKIQAIRHTVNPEVRFDYRPNFGAPGYDYYQWLQTDPNGAFGPVSRYQNFLYTGAPGRGRRSALDFGLSNALEMKVKSAKDSITGFHKVRLIDNLSFRGSYNFAVDSFNLSNLAVNLNTTLLNRVTLFANFNFDPYNYVNGRRSAELLISRSQFRLAQLATANFSVSTDLNPESWQRQRRDATTTIAMPLENTPGAANFPEYVDFDIPWTLFLDFTASYQNPDIFKQDAPAFAKSLTARGSINPTSKWKVQYTTGYDLTNKNLTVTRFDIYRDLHCWEMSIGWTPFGYAQGYFVNINVKSSMLRDLKISRNQSAQNRF
ncbi:MAG TPA: putative LPS assembly protein LptD [Adhaeribacter sp.]|nr:putative LPS assembly protein LptD [Adhaeribacter sp.]